MTPAPRDEVAQKAAEAARAIIDAGWAAGGSERYEAEDVLTRHIAAVFRPYIEELQSDLDRYRMSPTADGGFRFQWRDRALAAEAALLAERERVEAECEKRGHLTGKQIADMLLAERRRTLKEARAAVCVWCGKCRS